LAPCPIKKHDPLKVLKHCILLGEWYTFFVHSKELSARWERFRVHAAKIQDAPALRIDFTSERFF
jgi:hypothetical protein